MRTICLLSLAAFISALGSVATAQQPKPSKGIPPVLLTAGHQALCKVGVGDQFPAIELPKLAGGEASLQQLAGKQGTVVCIWRPDRWMSRAALKDLAGLAKSDVAEGFTFVGIAVGQSADAAQAELQKAGAEFTQLLDAEAATLAQVGPDSLPRLYVLDAQGKIVWFDIEFSEATRRELRQTLAALTISR